MWELLLGVIVGALGCWWVMRSEFARQRLPSLTQTPAPPPRQLRLREDTQMRLLKASLRLSETLRHGEDRQISEAILPLASSDEFNRSIASVALTDEHWNSFYAQRWFQDVLRVGPIVEAYFPGERWLLGEALWLDSLMQLAGKELAIVVDIPRLLTPLVDDAVLDAAGDQRGLGRIPHFRERVLQRREEEVNAFAVDVSFVGYTSEDGRGNPRTRFVEYDGAEWS